MGEMHVRGNLLRVSQSDDWLDRLDDSKEQARIDLASLVRLRANLLAPDEKALLEAYLKGGSSLRQLARLTAMKPSSAWRRVRRIIKRLHASAGLLCLEGPCGLSMEELAIVKDHVVRGFSIRDISRTRKRSYYHIRSTIRRALTLTPADLARKARETEPKSVRRSPRRVNSKNGSLT
jgi:hypothetical protein